MRDDELRAQGPPDTYDNTILAHATTCMRQLYWFLRGLDYKTIPPYFTWGRAFGAAANAWHSTQGKMEAKWRLAGAIAAARDEWEKDAPIESGLDTLENLEETIKLYVMAYGHSEPWTMLYEKGELGFRFPVPGTTIYYAGAVDAPIEWKPYGMLIREDKSTGFWLSDTYLNQWHSSSQVTGYLWATHQILGEEPFGAYMNIVCKRRTKELNDQFARLLVKRSAWQLAQFMRDTVLIADDIRREWNRWIWPKTGERNPMLCAGGAGRKPCLYRRLCESEMEPWDMEGKYNFSAEFNWRDKPWKPWEREGENE